MTAGQSILWRRLDQPGHDCARLRFLDPHWNLEGVAIFLSDRLPCRLEYKVCCDTAWNTVHGQVTGWVGDRRVDHVFAADADRRWRFNDTECIAVGGCVDVDLSFTPATNLLPIRRLQLPIGQGTDVRAAWLRFPEFSLEPLRQRYHRVSAGSYRYEALAARFVANLTVNRAGFVTHYPGLWKQEEGTKTNDVAT